MANLANGNRLFATTNVHRVAIMKKHNLSSFELSQAYLFFYDKLEKANWFLEQIMDTAEQDLESRLVQNLLQAPVNDGMCKPKLSLKMTDPG